MSGPSLGLGVTASGIETVEKLNAALFELESRLKALPAAAKPLQDLKKLTSGGGLGAGDELKALAGEIKTATQQQATALAQLAEAIKGGYEKVVNQTRDGGKKAKSSVAQARRELQEEFEKLLASGAIFSPKGLDLASKMGVSLLPGQKLLLAGAKETWAGVVEHNREKGAELVAQIKRTQKEIDTAWAQHQVVRTPGIAQIFDSLDGKVISDQRVQEARGFAALAKAEAEIRSKARLDGAKLEAEGIKAADALVKEAQIASAANRKFIKQVDERFVRGQGAVAKILEIAKEEAEAQAAATVIREVAGQKAVAAILTLSREFAAAQLEADQKRAFAGSKAVANILKLAHDRAAAEVEAAAIESQALQLRNAAFAAKSPASQARTVLGARTQLDAGLSVEKVRSAFGDSAVVAAQSTNYRAAYDLVHNSLGRLNAKVDEGIPKFKGLAHVMNEGHSAARGLASGFGAMSLTWGSLAPLLAGAALSHSFVQSIKIGAQTRQELETLRILSNESTADVKALENQLVSLGRNGPFGPRQIAEAMKILSLAGLNAKEVGQALGPALNLALSGGVNIEKAAESLVAIGTAFGYSAGQFDRVGDVVAKAAAVSMSSVDGMMESFRSASVVGQLYNVSLTDVATSLAIVANLGIRNSAAGTAVRQMYSELSGATSGTRKALKALGIETIDINTHAMRPLVDIFTDLDRALTNFQGKAGKGLNYAGEVRAIQGLTNQRGEKSAVADLIAFRKKVIDEGGNLTTELQRINKLVQNSFGFTAISAADLASTPLNQMKSVAASLQTTLFKAFEAIESEVLVVSGRLREAFGSAEFSKVVIGLATTIGNLTLALVENAKWVEAAVLGLVAYKAAMIGLAVGQGLASMLGAVARGFGAVSVAATGAAGATVLAAEANALAATTGVAAGASATAATAARVGLFGRLLTLLPGVGALIGVAASAWSVYAIASNSSNLSEKTGADYRATAVIDSLDKEIERLTILQKELRKTGIERYAEAATALEIEKRNRLRKLDADVEPLRAPRRRVAEMVAANPGLPELAAQAASGVSPSPVERTKFLTRTGTPLDALVKSYRDEVALAGKNETLIDAEYSKLGQTQKIIDAKQKQISDLARGNAEIKTAKDAENLLKDKKGPNNFEPPTPQGKVRAEANAGLSLITSEYSKQEQTLKAQYAQERKALDLQNKYKLISEAEYLNAIDALAEQEYTKEIANLERRVKDSEPYLKQLRALQKPSPEDQKQLSDFQGEFDQMRNDLASRKQNALIEKAGKANIADLGLTAELAKLADAVTLEEQRVEIEIRRVGMSAAEAAADSARLTTEATYVELLRKKNVEIDGTISRLADLDAQYIRSGGTDQRLLDRLEAVQRELAQRTSELDRVKAAQQVQGDRAATRASNDPSNLAPWEQMLRGWKNAQGMMRTVENDFKTSFMQTGETIWVNFFKTGKLHMGQLRDLIQDTLAKITYRKFIAEPLERMMDGVWGVLGQAGGQRNGGPAGTGQAQQGNALGDLFRTLVSPIQALVNGVSGVITGCFGFSDALKQSADSTPGMLMQILNAFGAGFASLMRTLAFAVSEVGGGGGLLGSIGGFIGKLFGGSGGSYNSSSPIPNFGAEGLIPGVARGGLFNAAENVAQFAKGASFTNQIFNSPTLFKFRKGGMHSLGQMGEAGPEAVMPLTRGSDGKLGVANHSGSQAAPVTNITIVNAPAGSQVDRKRNGTGGEDVLIKFKESIKADIANDFDNFTGVARNAGQRFGLNGAAGLAR